MVEENWLPRVFNHHWYFVTPTGRLWIRGRDPCSELPGFHRKKSTFGRFIPSTEPARVTQVAGKSGRGEKGSWGQRIDAFCTSISWFTGPHVNWIRKISLESHRDHLKLVIVYMETEGQGRVGGHYTHNRTVPKRGKQSKGGLSESMFSRLGIATFCWNPEKSLEWGQRWLRTAAVTPAFTCLTGSFSRSNPSGISGRSVLGLLLTWSGDWHRYEPKLPCRGSCFWPFVAYIPQAPAHTLWSRKQNIPEKAHLSCLCWARRSQG